MSRDFSKELEHLVDRLLSEGWRRKSVLENARDTLIDWAEYSLHHEPFEFATAMSILNLLVDVNTRPLLTDSVARTFLQQFSLDPDAKFLSNVEGRPSNLQFLGSAISPTPSEVPQEHCALAAWPKFLKFYSTCYGVSNGDPVACDKLWERVEYEGLLNAIESVPLNGYNQIIWFTDNQILEFDATEAYQALGLDWINVWESVDSDGNATVRAIFFCVPLEVRMQAKKSCRIPTAIDAWGHAYFFVPSSSHNGAWTNGTTWCLGRNNLGRPEGIHTALKIEPESAILRPASGEVLMPSRGNRYSTDGMSALQRISNRIDTVIETAH